MRAFRLIGLASVLCLQFFASNIAVAASDCVNTPWVKSSGRTCATVGLNSKKPVCNGQIYAVMCDDTKTHIRTCRSNVQCADKQEVDPYSIGSGTFGSTTQSYGTTNSNSNSGAANDYEVFRGKKFHCTEWDYKNKRPCKSGTFNEDCWGNCS